MHVSQSQICRYQYPGPRPKNHQCSNTFNQGVNQCNHCQQPFPYLSITVLSIAKVKLPLLHSTAAIIPNTPASTPAPIFAGVAAAFGDVVVGDSVSEPLIVTEGLIPPSVSVKVPVDVTFTKGPDVIVGIEVTLSLVLMEELDTVNVDVNVAEPVPVDDESGIVVDIVGVSSDVLETRRAFMLAVAYPMCVTATAAVVTSNRADFILSGLDLDLVLLLIPNQQFRNDM